MNVHELLLQGTLSLKNSGIETPRLDASLFLSHILKVSRSSLLLMEEKKLGEDAISAFNDMIERRKNGECAAYITGEKEFYGLAFKVNKNVLVPRPSTEALVEAALEIIKSKYTNLKNKNFRVLDLCTGSGAAAIAIKHEIPEIEMYATDISEKALEVAKENALRLLSKNSPINFYSGSLFGALPCDTLPSPVKFSLIVSNPPYIPTEQIKTLSPEVQNEPHLALDGGPSGLAIIEKIIESALNYLEKDGTLLLEAGTEQINEISAILEKKQYKGIIKFKDLSDHYRIIGGSYA